jgi:glycosyltransferase involved in cell wall biosynthesis
MISIVVPSYNREVYLPECVDSILRQTYEDWELIIVDDGSTDDSKMLYDYFTQKDPRIKVIYVEHGGISAARNAGVAASKGEYIAVFDSDDLMMPTRLEKNLKALKDHDFCTSYYLSSDEEFRREATVLIESPTKITFDDVKANNSWPHFMITAKRKCFEENPYREDFKVNDDAWLVWSWFKAGYTYKVIKEHLGIQRGHKNNTTKVKAKEIAKTQEIMNKAYDEYEG